MGQRKRRRATVFRQAARGRYEAEAAGSAWEELRRRRDKERRAAASRHRASAEGSNTEAAWRRLALAAAAAAQPTAQKRRRWLSERDVDALEPDKDSNRAAA